MGNCWTSTGSSLVPNRQPSILGNHSAPNFEICHVCDRNIERRDDIRHLTHWGLKFCKMHEVDGTPRCSCCDRFKTVGQMEYVNLGDGRKLCPDCYSVAILDPSNKFNRLIEKLREFYKELNLEVDKDIPILLVDKNYMYKIGPVELTTYIPLKVMTGAVELTSYIPLEVTVAAAGLTSYAPLKVMTITNCSKNGDNIEVKTAEKTLTKGQVKAMLLLFGIPEVIMGATLAHEMMHAWLFHQGCKKLDRTVCEGICEVMADLWLEWFCDEKKNKLDTYTTEQAQFTKNLKRFVADKMRKRVDKIYGEGFRVAKKAVSKSNLHKTLQHIVDHETLPPEDHSNSTC